MKLRTLLIGLVFVFLLVLQPRTAEAEKYNNAITANPIGLAFGLFNASWEMQTAPENSLVLSGYYWSITDWAAYGFGGAYRWYIVKEKGKNIIEGFGFGPAVSIGFWKWGGSSFYNYDGGTSIAIGGEAAYKWIWGGFVLEPVVRLMFNVNNISGLNYNAFGAGVGIGYGW